MRTEIQRTLYIKGDLSFPELYKAFDFLKHYASAFSNNGADGEGNAWLPAFAFNPDEQPFSTLIERYPKFFGIVEAKFYYIDYDDNLDELEKDACAFGAYPISHFVQTMDEEDRNILMQYGEGACRWKAACSMLDSLSESIPVMWRAFTGERCFVVVWPSKP